MKSLIKFIEKEKFLENRFSDCQNFLHGVTTFLPIISVFLDGICEYNDLLSSVKIGAVEADLT